MTLQRQRGLMYALIVGAFVFSGLAFYMVAHWLVWNDPLYQRLFCPPFRPVVQLAEMVVQFGVWCPLAAGLLLGVSVVVVHAWRWFLLPVTLLISGIGVFILVALL